MNITKMFDNTDFLEEHSLPAVVKKGYIASYLYNIELKMKKHLFPDMKMRDYTENVNRHFNQNNLVALGNNLVEKMYWLTDEVIRQKEEIESLKEEIRILKEKGDDGK